MAPSGRTTRTCDRRRRRPLAGRSPRAPRFGATTLRGRGSLERSAFGTREEGRERERRRALRPRAARGRGPRLLRPGRWRMSARARGEPPTNEPPWARLPTTLWRSGEQVALQDPASMLMGLPPVPLVVEVVVRVVELELAVPPPAPELVASEGRPRPRSLVVPSPQPSASVAVNPIQGILLRARFRRSLRAFRRRAPGRNGSASLTPS